MPGKLLALGSLLLLAALPAAAAEQQFFAESFGRQATANLAPRRAADSHPKAPPAEPQPAERSGVQRASGLVMPAVCETPEQRPQSAQAAGYATAPEVPPAAAGPIAASSPGLAESEPALLPAADASPVGRSGSSKASGFPRLAPRGEAPKHGTPPAGAGAAGTRSIVTVASSLAIVLGLFCMAAWLMRRTAPGGHAALPSDVFEVLGRAAVANRQQVQLLRCGGKLLLVAVTPEGTETLTEIDDPDEVVRLTGLCKAAQPGSATAAFRQALQQFAGQHAEGGFADRLGRRALRPGEPPLPREVEDLHG